MSRPIPDARRFDAYPFARTGARLAGRLGAADLPRLAELGAAVADELTYSIEGLADAGQGKPGLAVRSSGKVVMQCQRCLGPVEVPVEVDSVLELAPSQAAIDAATDDVDRVVGASDLAVATLVEDELILGLPMVARHENVHEGCRPAPEIPARPM